MINPINNLRKFFLLSIFFIVFFVVPQISLASDLYAIDNWGEEIRIFDESTLLYTSSESFSLDTGDTVNNTNGAAVDPSTNEVYVVFNIGGDRKLVILDMETKAASIVGDLGDKFADITFSGDGTLYGITGDGATTPCSLYEIDKSDATSTLLASYGQNWDGESIAYNSDDGRLYRATGDDVYAIDLSDPTTLINISIDNPDLDPDSANGLLYVGNNEFYIGDYWDSLHTFDSSTGTVSFLSYIYAGSKSMFYWPLGPEVAELYPKDDESNVAANTDLELTFNREIYQGTGNIYINDLNDDSVIETIDILSPNVSGWGTDSLIVDIQNLPEDISVYVNIDNTAVKDVSNIGYHGVGNNNDWNFSILNSSETSFSFVDDLSDRNLIDLIATEAHWNELLGSFDLDLVGWTQMDGATPGSENVSNSVGIYSRYPQIAIDSSDNIFVIWSDNPGLGGIPISRWNGSAWTEMDGSTPGYETIPGPGDGSTPQIKLDSNERPVVAWVFGGDVHISRWNGSDWTEMDGVTPGYENASSSANSASSPHFYLDSNNRPVIVWHEIFSGNREVFASRWNGSAWTEMDGSTPGYENVSNNSGNSWYPQVILNTSDNAFITWNDGTSGFDDIYISYWNGSAWTEMDGSTSGYENISNSPGFYSQFPQIRLDSSEHPIISWQEDEVTEIVTSRWNGSAWTEMDGLTPGYEIVSGGGSGLTDSPSVGARTDEDFFVVWRGGNFGNLETEISRWSGSAWTQMDGITPGRENVSMSPGVASRDPAVVVDSEGDPVVVWYENIISGTDNILISRFNSDATSSSQKVQSEKINGMTKGVLSATLTADDSTPGSSEIKYYLSNNGGSSWIKVQSGVRHTFSSAGDDLRWKAVLYEGSSPVLNSVSINYSIASIPGVLVSEDELDKDSEEYKCYKEHKKKYTSKSYKQDYQKVKELKKKDYKTYFKMKTIYYMYKVVGDDARDKLEQVDPETYQMFKEYRRYKKYKKYRECKVDVFGD